MQQQLDGPHITEDRPSRNIPRLLLFMLIFITLLYICFSAFGQHFENRSTFSILLGVVMCLIVQFRLVGWWGRDVMGEEKCDEIDFVRMKIKGVFGELNEKYVEKKNKKKYYYYKASKEDALFQQPNKELFESVMERFRGNSDENYNSRINRITHRWGSFLIRLTTIQKMIYSISKMYQSRSYLYEKLLYTINKYADTEYIKWEILLIQEPKLDRNQTNEFQQLDINNLNWKIMSEFIQEKGKYNQNRLKQTIDTILTEYKIFGDEMNRKKEEVISKLNQQFIECGKKRRTQTDINIRITQIGRNIQLLQTQIEKLKTKSAETVEEVFKKQVEIRLLRIQNENEEIKQSYIIDSIQKSTELLKKNLDEEEKLLSDFAIKSFNNKIINYINIFLDQESNLYQKLNKNLTIRSEKNKKVIQDNNNYQFKVQVKPQYQSDKLLQSQQAYQQILASFRIYINLLVKFSYDHLNNANQMLKMISALENYKIQYVDAKDDCADKKFIDLLNKLVKKEYDLACEVYNSIFSQQQHYENHDKNLKNISSNIKIVYDKLYRIKKEIKKISIKDINDPNYKQYLQMAVANQKLNAQLYNYVNEYINSKMPSQLKSIIKSTFSNQQSIQTQIPLLAVTQIQQAEEDPRQIRFAEYSYEYSKIDDQQHEPGKAQVNKGQGIINKLLNVFFQQWSNSEFFHKMIKQQIQIALNRKRPPIVGFISVSYLKIHEKQRDPIENIVVHKSQIFKCLFDLTLNFKGIIAVVINTKINFKQIPISVKLLIKQFKCPIRICFTPFCLGKSYASLLDRPFLNIQYCVRVNNFNITKIPFISRLIRSYILIKMRKKMLWPKRMTLTIPLAYKNPIILAIKQRNKYEKSSKQKQQLTKNHI